jgi:hypothetical protein
MLEPYYDPLKFQIRDINQRLLIAFVVGITLFGFYLRYRCLGCLGFRWDEDLTSLAVKGLLDNGVPEFPSGLIYPRFYVYQWVLAASVETFGFGEFSMRLPGVIFGTAMIPISYWVVGQIVNKQVGLIVATCIALSFWQVEMARTARMYAPFFLAYLIAAYAIYRVHYQNLDRVFSPWVLALALIALSLHQLAYSLSLFLLLAIPLNMSVRRSVSLILQACGIVIAYLTIQSIENWYFHIPHRAANATDGLESVASSSGLIMSVLNKLSVPKFDLLLQLISAFPMSLIVLLASLLLLTSFVLRVISKLGLMYRVLAVVAIGLAIFHQFNLVCLTLVAMLISLKSGIRGIRNPAWYWPTSICISILFLWLLAITVVEPFFLLENPWSENGLRKTFRALFDYPNFNLFWSFVLNMPLLSVPLALGTMWGIERVSRNKPDPLAIFLVGGFWGVLFFNGILKTKFEFFRYNLHLDPFFLMLVVIGLLAVPWFLSELGFPLPDKLRDRAFKRVAFMAMAAFMVVGVHPAAAVLTSTRDYAESSYFYSLYGLDTYDDFKTPAEYVRSRLDEDDIILVMDSREYWNYIGRVDYWIRSDNFERQTYRLQGQAYDRYLGVPVVSTESQLAAIIGDNRGGDTWIIFSQSRLSQTRWISPGLKAYLKNLDDHIVYKGLDGQTVVVRIPNESTAL